MCFKVCGVTAILHCHESVIIEPDVSFMMLCVCVCVDDYDNSILSFIPAAATALRLRREF